MEKNMSCTPSFVWKSIFWLGNARSGLDNLHIHILRLIPIHLLQSSLAEKTDNCPDCLSRNAWAAEAVRFGMSGITSIGSRRKTFMYPIIEERMTVYGGNTESCRHKMKRLLREFLIGKECINDFNFCPRVLGHGLHNRIHTTPSGEQSSSCINLNSI